MPTPETTAFGDAVAIGLFAGACMARQMGGRHIADEIEREGKKHASWLRDTFDPAGEAEYRSWLTQLEMTLWDKTMQELENGR